MYDCPVGREAGAKIWCKNLQLIDPRKGFRVELLIALSGASKTRVTRVMLKT